jgi:hypothetical protein
MNKTVLIRNFALLFALFSINQSLFAQKNVVHVDHLTGTATTVIPVYTVVNGTLSAQVSLINSGKGIKVKDVEGSAGMGWDFSGGGKISRDIRGLPDDVKNDKSSNARLGWLYNNNGNKIDTYFSIANDGNTATCIDETTDVTNYNANFSDLSDTEPDLYSLEAPGLSCKFVFDKNHTIQIIPYQDLKITYTTNSTTGNIETFKVTDDKGVTYAFSATSSQQSTIQTLTSIGTPPNVQTANEGSIAYFKTKYVQYKSGISAYTSWYLDSITDANRNAITFSYTDGLLQQSYTPVELYIGNTVKTVQYWVLNQSTPRLLNSIIGAASSAYFYYNNNTYTAQSLLSKITTGAGVGYLLNYSSVTPQSGNYSRYFLRDITSDQCNSALKYHFTYTGESYSGYSYKTALGDSSSKKIDYWGYASTYSNAENSLLPAVSINPSNPALQRYQISADNLSRAAYSVSIPGADRRTDPSTVAAGSLSQITYFDNGATNLVYEAHDFYDPTAAAVVQGGGPRIKQVIEYDGINTANNIVKNYSYLNPATGTSSGVPISLPSYAFTRPYTGTGTTLQLWTSATVRSDVDLSTEDHGIIYSFAKVSRAGAGSTLYEYYTPATNYDATAFPSCYQCTTADWAPTTSYVARPGCGAAGFMSNDKITYPYAPNTNYDFERGMAKSIKDYNEAGNVVSETNFSYQRTGTPIAVTGLKWDDNGAFKSYSKYTIYTSADELTRQVVKKITDLPPSTQFTQTTENYFYESAYHRLATRQQSVKSDGTIENNYIKYVKDYNTSSVIDPAVNALAHLQQQNQNLPIEQYLQVQKPSSEIKVTGGSVLKFKEFNFGSYSLYLPFQKLGFASQNGVTGFVPATVSSGNFVYDANYMPIENYTIYDANGVLQTSDDNHKHLQTSLSSLNGKFPVASVSNAGADEIGYYNRSFDVGNASFQMENGTNITSVGRSNAGSLAVQMDAVAAGSKTIKKNVYAKNYIFSTWINAAAGNSISLILTGTDNIPHVYPLNYAATGGNWKYYEIKVPVASLSATFTAKFKNNSSTIFLTDVLFYPENAEVGTTDYSLGTRSKTSETNTNGVSTYYESDNLGRLTLVYDQDRQIIERKSYHFLDAYQVFSDPTFGFSPVENITTDTQVTFTANTSYNVCQFPGITHTWNFGDGTAPVQVNSSSGGAPTHKFSSAGTYLVTLTANVPGYGTKTTTMAVVVAAPPPPPLVIPVVYVNNSLGAINTVTFSQSGVVKYTFTGAQLQNGTAMIPAQSFQIKVTCTGSYGSVKLDNGSLYYCKDYYSTNSYTFLSGTLAVPNSVTITLENSGCQ